MTSAATAKAAWFAARIQVNYPDAWPETIRGLIVHSADWPDALFRQFSIGESRADFGKLLRIAGYGVPDLQKALYCVNNTLTLIAQEFIQPFRKHERESRYVTNEMHLHNLPWPREVLLTLGETPVTLRVTLSYFIEPSPGEIGWEHRYRYQSFGLRFDINTPNENQDEFVKRMNKAARDEEERATTSGDSTRWRIGSQNRNLGSLHSDIWEGTAADIASCSFIGIYPTIGWWRERPHLGKYDHRVRYSLIVSLETPEIDVDIYTPVSTMIRVPVKIRT
ncbi:MAG: S8 family serine peptidase [Phaeodactylibacter sp.]|nr:S8 family serine peptidase [Phaeodactylibacter sp.]